MEQKRCVHLIGIGTPDTITLKTLQLLQQTDCLIGASRMIDLAMEVHACDCFIYREYQAENIISFLEAHPEYKKVVIVFSGDTGFYSGAKHLWELLDKQNEQYEVIVEAGVSSVIALAAKLHVSWEDAAFLSLHGKETDFIRTIDTHKKTFLLLSGRKSGERILKELEEFDMNQVKIHLGTYLGYKKERIMSGYFHEFTAEDFEGLCVAMIENPCPLQKISSHISDECFIRGRVPMTKAEVRSVSIAKLQLTRDAVVYDIGAGTGSVSIEAALSGERVRVYAIEKKEAAIELLKQNRKKFKTSNVQIIEGEAPQILEELEAPTHVFIGGSSGYLEEILKLVLNKNPQVRIVINAIALETLGEIVKVLKNQLLKDVEVVQLMTARSSEIGQYHLMTGMNPVWIISAGGDEYAK